MNKRDLQDFKLDNRIEGFCYGVAMGLITGVIIGVSLT